MNTIVLLSPTTHSVNRSSYIMPGAGFLTEMAPVVEKRSEIFDFSLDIDTGVFVTSAAVACSVFIGADLDPASRLFGSARVINSPLTGQKHSAVKQQVGNLVANNTYRLDCTANLSDGDVITLWAYQPCAGDGGLLPIVCSNLAASGTTIDDAYQMACLYNVFALIPSRSGGRLPPYPALLTLPVTVVNPIPFGNDLLVYPPDRNTSINALAPGVPVLLPAPIVVGSVSEASFIYEDATHIISY